MTGPRSTAPHRGASPEAIAAHYDLPETFFRAWLDPTFTYSCALWQPGDTLQRAQERKIDHVASLAGVGPGMRVLDLGCGWGGTLRRLVNHHGVARAVGLTLSRSQFEAVTSLPDQRIEVRHEGWEDHTSEAPYDAIVCIGALEHFARFGRGRAHAIASYRAFFERCRAMLAGPGGVGLQTIVVGDAALDAQAVRDSWFLAAEVFRQSRLPRVAEIVEAVEGLFEVTAVRHDGEHYERTCEAWLARLRVNRAEALAACGGDEGLVAHHERYLTTAARLFARGHANLVRMGLRPIGVEVPA